MRFKKKNYLIIGGIILSIIFLVIFLYPKTQSNLKFSSSECDEDLTHAVIIGTFSEKNQEKAIKNIKDTTGKDIVPINEGIQEFTWLNEGSLNVKAVVLINCADKINSGSYLINENNLILQYKIKKPFFNIIAECICAHELSYTIKNIEKKDYKIELIQSN
jgi:hypothetical protein